MLSVFEDVELRGTSACKPAQHERTVCGPVRDVFSEDAHADISGVDLAVRRVQMKSVQGQAGGGSVGVGPKRQGDVLQQMVAVLANG